MVSLEKACQAGELRAAQGMSWDIEGHRNWKGLWAVKRTLSMKHWGFICSAH